MVAKTALTTTANSGISLAPELRTELLNSYQGGIYICGALRHSTPLPRLSAR